MYDGSNVMDMLDIGEIGYAQVDDTFPPESRKRTKRRKRQKGRIKRKTVDDKDKETKR